MLLLLANFGKEGKPETVIARIFRNPAAQGALRETEL